MINEQVIRIVTEQFDSYPDEINEETDFIDDLDADSVDIVSLIMALEDEFEIEFDDEELKSIRTVGDVIDRLNELL